jgi:hypothetical protein
VRYGIAGVLLVVGIVFRLLEGPGGGYRPSVLPLGWTADGSLLFVHQEEEGGYDWRDYSCGGSGVYVLAEGSAPRPLFTGGRWCDSVPFPGAGMMRLSSDGRTAFSTGRSSKDCGEIVAADIPRKRSKVVWRECSAIMDDAAVSPDGRWLVARRSCSLRSGGGEPPQFLPHGCVDGDGRLSLAPFGGGAARSVGAAGLRSPVWSPDSRAILAEDDDKIVRVDLPTGEQRIVTEGYDPAWSPDGRWIAFTRLGRDGERSLYRLLIARADGSGERVLFTNREGWFANMETRTNGSPRTPLWSPDGQRIVFVRAHHRGGTLWSVRRDGTDLRRLTRPMPRMTHAPPSALSAAGGALSGRADAAAHL